MYLFITKIWIWIILNTNFNYILVTKIQKLFFEPIIWSVSVTWLMNDEWMNEWMMHLYSALMCIAVHPKHFIIMGGGGGGGSLLNHHQCAASTWMMRRLPQDNGASALTTHQLGGEEKESIKWMGIIRRPWLIRASGGNLYRTQELQPYSLQEVPWDF